MKLLFVHERLGAFGGAETNLQLAARELKSRGHSLSLLHGSLTGPGEKIWREIFRPCVALGASGNGAVRSALADISPDLIYVHKMADLAVIEELVASGIPLVRMVHDHDLYCMRSYKYRVFSRTICTRPASWRCIFPCGAFLARNRGEGLPVKWISYSAKRKEIQLNQRFQRMIVASNYMKNELLQNGIAEEQIRIHPPVPEQARDTLAGERVPSDTVPAQSRRGSAEGLVKSDRNLVLYVGQIIRGKGVDVLMESLARVKVPFEALIVGDGHHRSGCEKLSQRLGLGDRVHFPGFVSREELGKYFRAASVMVLSSVWPEPFGAVGLEGMRYGLPVVAFDAGGIREWLINNETGFLVPWMDRAQFAARVEELLLNKTLARQMGERGARVVAERFEFSDYITALENTFTQVVSEAEEEKVHA